MGVVIQMRYRTSVGGFVAKSGVCLQPAIGKGGARAQKGQRCTALSRHDREERDLRTDRA